MLSQRPVIEEAPAYLPLDEKQAGPQRLVDPNEVEVIVRESVVYQGNFVFVRKPKRVPKLTSTQEEFLEKFITTRLPRDLKEARKVITRALDGSEPAALDQLWCLYYGEHKEEIEDKEGVLNGVERYILQAAALKIFYKILEPELADAELKPVPHKINTLALLDAIVDPKKIKLPHDVSNIIFSYISPVELYIPLHLINKKALAACLSLKWYIDEDIKQNHNVFYTVGGPVKFSKRPGYLFERGNGYRVKIPPQEYKLSYYNAARNGKRKIFKSRYAALKYAEKIRRDSEERYEEGGWQPALYKVVCWDHEYDKNRKEVFFIMSQGTKTNILTKGEQSALVEFAEVSATKMVPLEANHSILNELEFGYKKYRSRFKTPFDSDSSFEYLDWYALQQSQRNWYTFYVILSAIFLTPLSLLFTLPMWLSAKKNEPIQKLEISDEEYKNIVFKEKQFKNNIADDEKKKSKESVVCKKPLAPGEYVENSFDGTRKIIYCDKYRKERLMFFIRCHENQITELTNADKEYLSQSEKQSADLVENLSQIERSRIKAG